MASTTRTAAPAKTTDDAATEPAPEVTSAKALTVLYSLKAPQRHAMLTVFAVNHPQLFTELAEQAR